MSSYSSLFKKDSENVGFSYDLEELQVMNIEIDFLNESDISVEDEGQTQAEEFERQEQALNQVMQQAQDILNKAMQEAEDILQEAQKKAQQVYEQKYRLASKEGFEEGVAKAKAQVEHETKQRMKQISEISDAIIREREECLQSQKEMIIDLATTIAQKVIGDKLLQDESVMFSVFKQAVQNMTPCKKLIVTVSNDDYTIMTSRFDQIKSITKSFEEIEIRVDDSSEKGTLRLESAVMLIDASVNKQIGLLRKEITKAL